MESNSWKKVLTIAPYTFIPASSGGQRAVYYLDQHLGKQVDLICVSTDGNNTGEDKVPLHFKLLPLLGSGIKRYINPVNFIKLKKLIKENQIEVIVIEHPYLAWLGWLLKLATGLPLVIRSHNIEALRFKALGKWWWRILADYERWAHRKASHSFFITKEDADYAVTTYGLKTERTSVITYGLEGQNTLMPQNKQKVVVNYKSTHQIPQDKTLLLFNGIFGYPPNDQALEILMDKIYPELLKLDANFHLLICGLDIPAKYQHQKTENLTVLGFVPDIEQVFQAAEIFLNPIWLGGGIKTKLVEALAGGAAAVSFQSGAIGIDADLLEGKLAIVPDQDIKAFAQAILTARAAIYAPVPPQFLAHFDWDQIAKKAVHAIRGL
jgi:glycosyltransferase involved in cell wall biosynthesis